MNDNGTLRRIAADGSVTTTTVTNVASFVINPTGAVYVLKFNDGLYAVSSTGATTLLIPMGIGLVLGSASPTLGTADGAMAALGAKQILIMASRSLAVVTLP